MNPMVVMAAMQAIPGLLQALKGGSGGSERGQGRIGGLPGQATYLKPPQTVQEPLMRPQTDYSMFLAPGLMKRRFPAMLAGGAGMGLMGGGGGFGGGGY